MKASAAVTIVTSYLLWLGAPESPQLNQQSVTDIVRSNADAVVLIVAEDSFGNPIGKGSGFFISPDGKIVTNYHVIKGAQSALAKLSNGASFKVEGTLVSSEENDIAVLKVAGKNLPFLKLEETDNVAVGQHVVAIGSPLGLENTVSDGIVSGIREGEKQKRWIQISVPVSRGNSGGPLMATNGKVVGVVTMGVDPGEAQNLNFAVPVGIVRNLVARSGEAIPLSAASNPTASLWTSVRSGRDFRVKQQGEYLYTEWIKPPELAGDRDFDRSELKKNGSGWSGQSYSNVRCQMTDDWGRPTTVRLCAYQGRIEIKSISASRIEGVKETFKDYDCFKCKAKGSELIEFVWIPKEK